MTAIILRVVGSSSTWHLLLLVLEVSLLEGSYLAASWKLSKNVSMWVDMWGWPNFQKVGQGNPHYDKMDLAGIF